MANKKTVALTTDEYNLIIDTMRSNFEFEGRAVKPNDRIATVLVLEANLGMRVGDILKLKFKDIIKDGNRFRLNVIEEKTKKKREFTVPLEIYNFIKMYCLENAIKSSSKIFDVSERSVQRHLKLICDYLKLERISTHSFRKKFATDIYVNNKYNIEMVRELLQHSSISITQRYVGIRSAEVEEALERHVCLR